eukprot:6211804-Pleurochrysis_carterae.AAC.2
MGATAKRAGRLAVGVAGAAVVAVVAVVAVAAVVAVVAVAAVAAVAALDALAALAAVAVVLPARRRKKQCLRLGLKARNRHAGRLSRRALQHRAACCERAHPDGRHRSSTCW